MNRTVLNHLAVLLVVIILACVPALYLTEDLVTLPAVENKVKPATHVISAAGFTEDSNCSATAISRYALLTASHCEQPSEFLTVDGVPGAKIEGILRDGNDHSIFLLRGREFDSYVPIGSREFKADEKVFIWGNPSYAQGIVYVKQIRQGQYKATHVFKSRFIDILGFSSKPGDSGSGVFAARTGELLGVVTFIGTVPIPPAGEVIAATGAVRLGFSKSQLDTVAQFEPSK